MGPFTVLLLGIFALSSAVPTPPSPHDEFFTIGKESIYSYESYVVLQTDLPASFTSEYGVRAKLHVQKNQANSLLVYLDNIVFSLENGRLRENITNDIYVPIPKEAEPLKLPFQIQYDSDGKVKAVIFDASDKEWSTNIKKSITSVFQIDNGIWKTMDFKLADADMTTEETVYGLCKVVYDILPREDYVSIVKTTNPRECRNDLNKIHQPKCIDSVDLNRVYKISRKETNRIERVESRGDVIISQFRSNAEMKVFKTLQRFVFIEEVAASKQVTIKNPVAHRSLIYEDPLSKCRDLPMLDNIDITGGRTKYNNDVLIPKVQSNLDQFLNLLDENQLTLSKPNVKTSQVFQNLLSVLENFDLSSLEHTFALLQEQSQTTPKLKRNINLFVQILPYVGTRSSAVFIRNLIRKQKIEENMAIRVLRDYSVHIHCPNEKLLIELEDLLTMGEENSRIRRAAVLAFASLMNRIYIKHYETPTLDKYVDLFMKKILSSGDVSTKVLYIHALANIGTEHVVMALVPVITGKVQLESNLRTLTLWALAPLLERSNDVMMKYIWPILSDRQLDTSVRKAAYNIYVRTKDRNLNRFMQLYWLMREETNERFYNFHYNTLKTISKLKYFDHEETQVPEIARSILRMSRHPIVHYANEGIFVNDFLDQETGAGGRIENMFAMGEITNVRFTAMSRIYDYNSELFTVHIGVVAPGLNLNKLQSQKKENLKNASFQVIIRRHGRIIMTYVHTQFDPKSLVDIARDLGITLDPKQRNELFEIPFLYARYVATDFGVPLKLYEMLPTVQSIYFKFDQPTAESKNLKFSFQIKTLAMYDKGMRVYNPINDLWHGLQEIKTINYAFGLSFSVQDIKPASGKIIFNKLGKDDIMGIQMHTENAVVIDGEHAQELLSQFHKDNSIREIITRGDQYKNDVVVYEKDWKTVGQRVEFKLFDCDRDVSRGSMITKLEEFDFEADEQNFIAMALLKIQQSLLFTTGYGSCGFGIRLNPLENVDHIEIKVAVNVEKLDYDSFLVPFNFEIQFNGATKSVQNTDLATYESTFALKVLEQQRDVAVKWGIIHKEDVERKFHFDLHFGLKEDHIDAKMNVSLGESNNLGVINFDIKGFRSEDQERILKEKQLTYGECRQEFVSRMVLNPVSLDCAIAHANLHRYTIDINVNDVQNKWVKIILDQFHALRHQFAMYVESKNHKSDAKPTPIHIDVVYPLSRNEWDVKIDTPRYNEVYTGIPRNEFYGLEEFPRANIFFSYNVLDKFDYMSSIDTCVVGKDHVLTFKNNIRRSVVPNDWTLYLKGFEAFNDAEAFGVYVKAANDGRSVALRINLGDDLLEFVPQGQDMSITVNGTAVTPVVGKYTEEPLWNYLMVESPKMIMFSTRMHGLHVMYDGRTVRLMNTSSYVRKFEGQCFEQDVVADNKIDMSINGLFMEA